MSEDVQLYVEQMGQGLGSFLDTASEFRASYGSRPVERSRYATELGQYPQPQSIVTQMGLIANLANATTDHTAAFLKSLAEPVQVIACGSCVRAALESAAIGAWLADVSVDAVERIKRGFALRYEGQEQQLKFGKSIGAAERQLTDLEAQIGCMEATAIGLGYPKVTDRNGKRTGIGMRMPSSTDIIRQMLDGEAAYRVLSAVAHGHMWAITKLSFDRRPETEDVKIFGTTAAVLTPILKLDTVTMLSKIVAKASAILFWSQVQYFGWDARCATSMLDALYVAIGDDDPTRRFWKG